MTSTRITPQDDLAPFTEYIFSPRSFLLKMAGQAYAGEVPAEILDEISQLGQVRLRDLDTPD